MNTLTEEGVDALRARLDAEPEPPRWADIHAGCDPDDDDESDGEDTQEIDCPIVEVPEEDGHRRPAFLLTAEQWQQHDYLLNYGVSLIPVGEGCAWTATEWWGWLRCGWQLKDIISCCGVTARPSSVRGGTFILFDLTPAFTEA